MKIRRKRFVDFSPVEFLILRDKLGLGRYRKMRERDPQEREILLELALKKIEKIEKNDFIPLGKRRRMIRIP